MAKKDEEDLDRVMMLIEEMLDLNYPDGIDFRILGPALLGIFCIEGKAVGVDTDELLRLAKISIETVETNF